MTSFLVGRYGTEKAEQVAAKLREATEGHHFDWRFLVCPAQGEMAVYAETDYTAVLRMAQSELVGIMAWALVK